MFSKEFPLTMFTIIIISIILSANVEAINYRTCYQCNGDNCRNPQIIMCPLEVNGQGNEQCFSKWNEHGVLIELGCKSNYNDRQINYFITNKLLQLCDDNNCNNYNINNYNNNNINNNITNLSKALHQYKMKALLECWHCKYDECEKPQPKVCKNATPNDQCFTLFNTKNNIIEMGCLSNHDNNFIKDNIKQLFLCNDQSNCNNYTNIPKPNTCLQCNSYDATDCAINPTHIQTKVRCSALPITQCYVRTHTVNGTTERGCASDLNSNDLLACLSNNLTDCLVCNDENCNDKIFPEDRRSCHRCTSLNNSNCDYMPNSPSICPIYSDDLFCATKLVNGHTYRGCSTDFQCDDSDQQYCQQCYKEDNCNVATLKGNNIGYPGIWQKLPLSCYLCHNETDCDNLTNDKLFVCNGRLQQNCYTIFNEDGTVIERGCSDELYSNPISANYCNRHPEYCKFCKSDHCNEVKSLNDYKECLFCDSSKDTNCTFNALDITDTRSCYKACLTALYPRNAEEENPAYELTRGCLDDLELDDRDLCSSTNMTCQSCTDDLCNTITLGKRFQCYTCEDDECELPKSSKCKLSREHDQCYMLFNDDGQVTRMGCESDLSTEFVTQHKRQLFLCDNDENCNNLKNIPKPYTCQSCNSQTNPQCAAGTVTKYTDCRTLPYTSCYTRLDENGITERGCLADLNDAHFNDCITSDPSKRTCELCEGNGCNNKVYPEGRRSCYRCNSTWYSACEDYPKSFASICPIYKDDDACVTKLENGHTLRGCASELNCDPNQPEYCRYCSKTDNCNSINLRAAIVGVPGKWQNLPLNCLSCENDGCINSNNISTMQCKGNLFQTCMTVFDLNDEVIMRGCSDVVNEMYDDYCDENAYHCIRCKSNHCNNIENRTDLVDCYFCDSSEDPSCTRNYNGYGVMTRKCHKSCMVALYPQDNSTNPSYELTRTCLDDLEIDDRNTCGTTNNTYCVKCDESYCNVMDLPEKRHECFFCDHDECETITNKTCQLHHPNEQCYILIDTMNNIENLGCRSDLTTDIINDLLMAKKLLLCDGPLCNNPDIIPSSQTCIECNSEMDPLCATNPNFIMNTEYCTNLPYTNCFTRITEDGHTVRGCLSSLDGYEFLNCTMGNDALCATCQGDKCNQIDVFPLERLRCHQCDSLADPQCAVKPSSLKVCPLYKANDKCITNLRDFVTYRGCASSNVKCDNEHNELTCQICETNGCNNANLATYENVPGKWQDLPLTCYTCQNQDDCKDMGVYRPCLNNRNDRCMTVFDENDTVIRRGCSDLVQAEYAVYCLKHPNKCMNCNSNGCNVAKSLKDYVECLSCDSALHATCMNNVTEIQRTRNCYKYCMTALYPIDREEDEASYALTRTCYDDMDQDDRERCVNNTNSYCRICNETRCNTDIMPKTRFQCYMCSGQNCQEPQIGECYNYRDHDQCYIRYDERYAIVSMGCRSEFTNAQANELLKQHRLFLCDTENCNTFDNLPSIRKCVLCNSRTDYDCAINPSAVKSRTTCRLMPFTDCYTRILSDGATERGCLSNLYDNEFLTCLNGTSTTCEACQEDECNMDIYPKERLKCHICDSASDINCEMKPQHLQVCPQYKEGDVCVTTLKNGITLRHCHSSLSCDNDDPRYCNTCSLDGCNIVNLAKISQDANYGKWQELPLTCLSCTNDECKNLNNTQTEECGPNVLQDCVTIFDNANVVRRGCSDTVDYDYYLHCESQEDNCFRCKSNKCNTATLKTNFTECIYCDSETDVECISNPDSDAHSKRLCQNGCMTALYTNDLDSSNASYHLIRTCLTDKELKEQKSCAAGSDKNCIACSTDNCNNHKLPETRLSCYTCKDNSCEKPTPQMCSVHKTDDKCYATFNDKNSLIEMGCISSLVNVSEVDLLKTKRTALCSGNNCNDMRDVPNTQMCMECNSINEHECATDPKEIDTVASCNMMPYTTCYTKLNSDGTTQRGCLTDLPEDDFANCALNADKNCSICVGAEAKGICNRNIFPEDRQQCYVCTSEEDQNCESYPKGTKPCPIVSLEESCVTALSENITVRGCRSSIYCDENDVTTCRSCFGTECNAIDLRNRHDDNYHGLWQDLPLKCYTCSGYNCHNSLGVSTLCSTNHVEQDCKTVFTIDGKVKRRGCSDHVDDYEDRYCREHPELCFTCKSNECNIAWNLNEYIDCVFCDSMYDPQCIRNPNNSTILKRQCYGNCMVSKRNNALVRTCLDDKEWSQHKACHIFDDTTYMNSDADCFICSDNNCNTFPLPANRLKCHVCDDASCTNTVIQYCDNNVENDGCFAKYNNKNMVEFMGCLSSLNSTDINNWSQQNLLYKCNEAECNDLTKLPVSTTCFKCDSSINPKCAQQPEAIKETEVCSPTNNQCITQILPNGHTSRGCLANFHDQNCVAVGTCDICSGSNCNWQIFPANRLKCYICDAANCSNCIKDPNNIQVCVVYGANSSCVTKYQNDLVWHGCTTDLSCDTAGRCDICDGNACNGSSTTIYTIQITSIVLGLLLIYVNKFIIY